MVQLPPFATVNVIATNVPNTIAATSRSVFCMEDNATGLTIVVTDGFPSGTIGQTVFVGTLFDYFSVDYGLSQSSIFIDLTTNIQSCGFAQGDSLTNITEIRGTAFNDV